MQDSYSNNRTIESPHKSVLQNMFEEMYSSEQRTKLGDVFSNPQLDLGLGTYDPTTMAVYPQARTLTWNLQRIEAVMRADPFFVRALEYRSSKPIRHGIDLNTDDIDSVRLDEFQRKIKQKLNPGMREALFEADAFGWSGLLIVIDGEMNRNDLKTPLKLENITEGKFLGLRPLTRWYMINPTQELINELGDKHRIYDPRLLGTPLMYNVSFEGDRAQMFPVHRSRLIITARNRLSFIEKKVEHHGGTSILEQGFDSLSKYHALVSNIHRMLQKALVPVLTLDDLASQALQTQKGRESVREKIEMVRSNLSNHNMLVLGEGDELRFEQAQLAGMEKQLAEARLQVSAAFNTPPHELFFEEQKHDKQQFVDFIQHRQTYDVAPMYDYLLPLLYLSEYGEKMPDYTMTFKPLENQTLLDIASARKLNTETLEILYEKGIIDKKTWQDTLADIDGNPSDILRNLNPEYKKFIDKAGEFETWNLDQIRLAEALNKSAENVAEERTGGRLHGGNPKSTKKPTPDVDINPDKRKGDE